MPGRVAVERRDHVATLREHACRGEAEDAGADDDRAHRGSMPASRRTASAWQTPAVRRLLVPLAVACVLAVASPASADLHVGLMDPAYQGDMPRSFFRDLGLLQPKVLRYDLYWNQVAPASRPTRATTTTRVPRRDFDVAMLEEAAAGFEGRVVVTVWRTPTWAFAPGGDGTAYSNAPDPQAYGTSCTPRRSATPATSTRTAREASTRCRASTTGRSGTSRTSTARCGHRRTRRASRSRPRSSRRC